MDENTYPNILTFRDSRVTWIMLALADRSRAQT